MSRRIFIGGTGRSGTTILYRALGCHEAIHSLPDEMRFLVDPDGLITLIDSLTDRYSPVLGREALYRFERLMRVYLTAPETSPYEEYNIADWLGGEYYWDRLDQFCSALVDTTFAGSDLLIDQLEQKPELLRKDLKAVKYFSDRNALVSLAAAFVDDLFLHAAQQHDKNTWCEKTPNNLLHVDFLWELFPESVFIHIKRDPRGVVHSLTKQPWAPNELRTASLFLLRIYERWFDIKARLDFGAFRYLELKLEDLARDPVGTLAWISSRCGLDNRFQDVPEITLDKVQYWQEAMSRDDQLLVNNILGNYIELMGYSTAIP